MTDAATTLLLLLLLLLPQDVVWLPQASEARTYII